MGSAGHQLGEGAFSRAIAGPWRGGVGWAAPAPRLPAGPPAQGMLSLPLCFLIAWKQS